MICLSSASCGFILQYESTIVLSVTSVDFYLTTRHHIPEDSPFHSYRGENLIFNIVKRSSLWPRIGLGIRMRIVVVKLSLCLDKHHSMKTYDGVKVKLHHS
jgi:hypothetical protein